MNRHQYGYNYRLTQDQADEIRRLHKSTTDMATTDPQKWTYERLQKRFGVGRTAIYKVLSNRTYISVKE